MSLEQATQFIQLVRDDKALAERLRSGKKPTELSAQDIVNVAAEMGYVFTTDEFQQAVGTFMMQSAAELNPEDLEYVKAAGFPESQPFC